MKERSSNFIKRLFGRDRSLCGDSTADERDLTGQLISTKEEYKYIFDYLQAGFWMWDVESKKIVFASKCLSEILQLPLDYIYKRSNFWEDILLDEHKEAFYKKNELLLKGEIADLKYSIKAGDGRVKWIHEQTFPRINDQGEVTHAFGRVLDISDEVAIEKDDAARSLTTDFIVREKLSEFLQDQAVKNFGLFTIELDKFHEVTENLDDVRGQRVLKSIRDRFEELRRTKSFLAVGNNGIFNLLLYNFSGIKEINKLADSIIKTVSEPLMIDGSELCLTASVGISLYPEHGLEKSTLIDRAQGALQQAKDLGENNFKIYSLDKNITSHKRIMLERDLREAIENGDFELYYQPQVNPKKNVLKGAEALIRWRHKKWGLVSPNEFIPIAEKNHLIDKIDDWVIQNVCKQIAEWKKQGLTLYPISINISPYRFLKTDLIDIIEESLRKYGVSPRYITIEITEGSLLHREKIVLDTLMKLKALGIKLALDDFGTGYSTFQYLRNFDVDVIKIDQSFVQNLFSNGNVNAKESGIVSSFLYLAETLDVEVIAEGVEEPEQLDFFRQKQCETIQGYIYSKPLPKSEFELIVKRSFIKPSKRKRATNHDERRKYSRFKFPFHLPAKMYITKVGKKNVSLGYANILVENISLGGMLF